MKKEEEEEENLQNIATVKGMQNRLICLDFLHSFNLDTSPKTQSNQNLVTLVIALVRSLPKIYDHKRE